jgi:hypothetical protein
MFKYAWRRFKFGAIASALILGCGYALAQSGGLGGIITSPVVVPGFLPFNGGPQASVIAANGGTFTANGTTAVTITNTNITANSVVIFGLKTASSVSTSGPFMFAVTPGVSFQIKSFGSDASVYNYWILG